MRSPFARWKVRHLVGSWVGYWAILAAATLTPAAIALWKATRAGTKGDASASLGDGGLHVHITVGGATAWDATIAITTLALAIAGPPLVLWLCWILSASRDSAGQHEPGQLTRGDELPLRREERERDARR